MPLGLMTAPATYQQLKELPLPGFQWFSCLIYLDDVTVSSKEYDEQVDHLHKVLTHTGSAGLKVKARKCVFFTKGILYGTQSDKRVDTFNPRQCSQDLELTNSKTIGDVMGILGL